ncbi:hypothetical protein M7I_3584 [Glarea lozoyensis 74030]|uniref:BTB/POZ domain-containing protein n=1 Tax=Glarea lozoyensis (strain ATCC 74030 / MF5533) TaxID=1104152 RepID=H0ELW1_GLAL7|nr:hypothetical protein M7I_3584 [Glarea lozoyensis 74030]
MAPARKMNTDIPNILPHERVFPIQIGSELFRLSGASISSDGYHVQPRDGSHYVKLFADAQFYSCFAVFFSTPTEVFPGLNRDGLLRPPSIMPPAVPNRSADTFAEILHLLRGYPLRIRDEDHRAELLRDCKYFHLKGLEQKLIRHSISFNLARRKDEITLRLEDVRQSGISIGLDRTSPPPDPQSTAIRYVNYARPFVDPKPYELVLEIGDECTKLHFQSHFTQSPIPMKAEFFGNGKTRISRLFEVVATKLNLPTTQPLGLLMKNGGASSQPASPGNTPLNEGDLVRCYLAEDAYVRLDGRDWRHPNSIAHEEDEEGPRKKRRMTEQAGIGGVGGGMGIMEEANQSWIVKTGQWRLRIQNNGRAGKMGVECVLVAVKLDVVSGELGRNSARGFLGG